MSRYFKLAIIGIPVLIIGTAAFTASTSFYRLKAGGAAAAPAAQTPPPAPFPVPQVASPSEFSSQVNTLSTQTTNRVAQDAAAALPKTPFIPPVMPTPTNRLGQTPTPVAPSVPVMQPTPPPVAVAPTQPAAAPSTNNFGSTAPSNAPSAYSGFGSPAKKTNQPAQQNTNPQNNGWQVQY